MTLGRARHFGNALTDHRLGNDHLRATIVIGLGLGDRRSNGCHVVTIDAHRVPVLRFEISLGIFALRNIGHRIERHIIGIINEHEVVQAVVTGKRDRFLGHTFLKASVSHQRDDMMIKNHMLRGVESCGSTLAGNRVANRIAHSLTKRTRGRLDARRFAKLRMTRRHGMQLTEIFQIVARNSVAGKVQPTVEEHRAVTGRKNEAVAVEPLRGIRAVAQGLAEKHRTDLRTTERQTEVTGIAGVHGIHGKSTGFIGGFGKNGGVHGSKWCSRQGAPTLVCRPRMTSRHLYRHESSKPLAIAALAASNFVKIEIEWKISLPKIRVRLFFPARTANNDPFVYRLGLQVFILARRVRLPYGSPLRIASAPSGGFLFYHHRDCPPESRSPGCPQRRSPDRSAHRLRLPDRTAAR